MRSGCDLHPLGQLLGDREPEPGPACLVARVEALEELVAARRVDARPAIRDGELRGAVLRSGADGHRRALGRVAEGVVEQDAHDLCHPFRSHAGNPSSGSARSTSVWCWRARPELARDLPRQCRQVDLLALHRDRPGVEPRQVEQVDGQLLEARDLLAHRLQELAPRLVVELLVLEQLDEAAEREDRRAQLVRGVGDELLARAVDAAELLLHLVERARELPSSSSRVTGSGSGSGRPRQVARARSTGARGGRSRARDQEAASSATAARRRPPQHPVADELDGRRGVAEVARVDRHPVGAIAEASSARATWPTSSPWEVPNRPGPASDSARAARALVERAPRSACESPT